MNNFIFENATKTFFGKGCVKEYLCCLVSHYGKNVMLCYGGGSIKNNGVYDEVMESLRKAGKSVTEFSGIMSNPTYKKVLEGARLARENRIDLILGVGGGSVMDCCKAISLAAVYQGDVWADFWARPGIIDFEPLPLGVIVTAAGTGSEMNGGAVITNEELKVKTGKDYPKCNPKFALLDPSYTFSVPKKQMVSGGFDTLSHIMEIYFSRSDEENVSDDIAKQGIFSAGGITVTSEGTFDPENQWEETGAGQTAHVDHANVFYQIPADETGLPMVFLHGYGQSRMGWMTTPDGREGWSDLFLKKGHSVFLIDEPRRGEAGGTSVAGTISTKTLDQRWYTQFRIGRWVDGKSVANEGSQFPNDDASVDQFFRQMTPDTGMSSDMGGDFDNETVSKAVAATIDEVYARTGKNSILVTHSQGGGPGWTAANYTDHIAAIIAIEPGGAPGPDTPDLAAVLSKNIPVTMYFGDYIDNGDPAIQATGMWQMMRQACYAFRDAYNAQGGNCAVVDLPQEGITGNDHFLFQDLNNDVIADHVENWIAANVSADGTYEPIQVSSPAPEEQTSSGSGSAPEAAPASSSAPAPEAPAEPESGKTLVIYFSASGNTKAVAEVIAKTTGADTYELVTAEPYTSADLDWTNENSRVNTEHNDPSHRTALAGTPDLSGYDTIFLGYPLWWREAPSIVWNFVENTDLSGKTMIPFCTSTSSPFGTSGDTLKGMAPSANWLAGERFGENLNESAVTQWVNSLNLAG